MCEDTWVETAFSRDKNTARDAKFHRDKGDGCSDGLFVTMAQRRILSIDVTPTLHSEARFYLGGRTLNIIGTPTIDLVLEGLMELRGFFIINSRSGGQWSSTKPREVFQF